MDTKRLDIKLMSITFGIAVLVILSGIVHGQSCGPRVSARLLAEIPCDMSQSSYCNTPGSAYPWNSVKRYINDNQGLVRRMYGDEKHSSVLLNEIDEFKQRFDMLRQTFEGFRSRTVYGRSARGHKSSHRKPRPQLFEDDDNDVSELSSLTPDTPATIIRVVTETSIKVGDAITQSMTTQGTSSVSYEPAAEIDSYSTASSIRETELTTQTTTTTTDPTTFTSDNTQETTTQPYTDTDTSSISTENNDINVSTTQPSEDAPIAMQRIGHVDFEDEYDFDPKRKTDSFVLQNSVEEKTRNKEGDGTRTKPDEEGLIDGDLVAQASSEEIRDENSTATEEEDEGKEEEVPRRGINACPVKNEVIAPYWANNTRGETLALLNVHPFEQYVHFEKCAFENHQMLCREGCRCEQQYRLHRLLAFDPKNECRGIFSDWFRFPSCCVCICYDLTPDMPRQRSRKGRVE